MSEVKKRGRKKKETTTVQNETATENIQIEITEEKTEEPPVKVLKKRGRKPKGGKLMVLPEQKIDNEIITRNVILHLKCSMKDLLENTNQDSTNLLDPLVYNPSIPPNISTYDPALDNKQNFALYDNNTDNENEEPKQNQSQYAYEPKLLCYKCNNSIDDLSLIHI